MVFWIENGKMFGWEGIFDCFGFCFGFCIYVWNYEQAMAFIFVDLVCSMWEVEFGYVIYDDGFMSFWVNLFFDSVYFYCKVVVDG